MYQGGDTGGNKERLGQTFCRDGVNGRVATVDGLVHFDSSMM
jgi:hypothetical protein